MLVVEPNNQEVVDAANSAVYVRSAQKSYGIGKRRSNILKSLNMTVKKGTIYGLLGASGCGKTTLLSCIVGRRSLDSGEIYVFGSEPGTKESGIPGRRVGYMPQELALYGEFNIKETLEYFGRLYRLPNEYVHSQMEFLFKLLDLPPGHRYVKSLSGGQQRRVSFAVALFHDPELLILDEPTVGLDPLLSKQIWNHLVQLSSVSNRTVIITTHYIEEARQSHAIGMMRSGRLLAEDSPQNLLAMHNMSSLEDVFLKLCMKNDVDDEYSEPLSPSTSMTVSDSRQSHPSLANTRQRQSNKSSLNKSPKRVFKPSLPSPHRIMTLTHKNCIQTFRNFGMLVFNFVLPALTVSFFCLAVGHDPTSLKIAIVNDELTQGSECNYSDTCNYTMLGCRYLRFLNNETISQIAYSNYSDAIDATQNGYINGVVHIGENFTDELKLRELEGPDAQLSTIIGSQINVALDWSNQQTSRLLQRQFLEAFENFGKDFVKSCSQEENAASLPLAFMDPVYGSKKTSFSVSMTPGACLSVVYIMAIALTALAFVAERRQGLLDRVMVAGVQTAEILFAHLINQFLVSFGQTVAIFLMVILVFKVPLIGSIPLAFLLALMQGLCGMCIGLLISTVCSEEITALQMGLGIFYPNVLLSGVLWPVDGIPSKFFRYAVFFLPQTYAIESMNGIFARGWGIERPQIYFGFLITFAWIFGLLALSLLVLRIRKYTG